MPGQRIGLAGDVAGLLDLLQLGVDEGQVDQGASAFPDEVRREETQCLVQGTSAGWGCRSRIRQRPLSRAAWQSALKKVSQTVCCRR